MSEAYLLELIQSFAQQPQAVPQLLASLQNLNQFFEDAKRFIQEYATIRHELELAKQAMQMAWAVAEHTQSPEHFALAHWCSALYYDSRAVKVSLNHTKQALDYYRQVGQSEKEGRLLFGYASQRHYFGFWNEAEADIERAIECLRGYPNYPAWPQLYINLAQIQQYLGRYAEAFANAKQAERLAITFGLRNPERLRNHQWQQAQALVNQGFAAIPLGDFGTSEKVLQEAQQLADAQGFTEIAARVALNLARIAHIKGALFSAVRYLDVASKSFKDSGYEIDLASIAIEKAELYDRLTMRNAAQQAANQAAQLFAEAGIVAESAKASLLSVRLALALNLPKRARLHLDAIAQLGSTLPPLQQALRQAYQAHPLLQTGREQFLQAFQSAEQAVFNLRQLNAQREVIEAELIATQLAALLALPNVNQRLEQIVEIAHHQGMSALEQEACVRLAQHQSAAPAVQTLQRATAIIAYTRREMPIEELKANLLTGHAPVYTQLIEAQLKRRHPTDAAHTLLEAKGGIWSDLATPVYAYPDTSTWSRARFDLDFWRNALRTAQEPEQRKRCEEKLQEAEAAFAEAARYHARLREPKALPELTIIQNSLNAKTVALEYMVGTTHIWVCVLTATHPPRWQCLGKCTKVKELLERFATLLRSLQICPTPERRRQVAQAQQTGILTVLQQLHELLITPLLASLPEHCTLLIAPDGYLFETPWTALYDGYLHLNQRFTISLTPSLVLLGMQQATAASSRLMVDRPPRGLGYRGEPPLNFVDAELAAIQQIYPTLVIQNPATVADLNGCDAPFFLHIAAHGHVHRSAPLFSYLALADGQFLLADVFNLNLQGTRLVALSACDTGTTPEQGGVTLALAGAFLCAGAETVLASLWSVDDQATLILATAFYQQLRVTDTPAQALQSAQQAVRASGYLHPFYWAAFQPLSRLL